jgi:hypothetical protein
MYIKSCHIQYRVIQKVRLTGMRPVTHYDGYQVSFLGIKWPGNSNDNPSPSCAEGIERVQLYLYSPSGPS